MAKRTHPTETTEAESPSFFQSIYQTVVQTADPITSRVGDSVRYTRDFATTKATATVGYVEEVVPKPLVEYTKQALNTAASVRDQTYETVKNITTTVGGHATNTRDFAANKVTATRDYATNTASGAYDYTKQTASSAYNYGWETGASAAEKARSTAQSVLPEKVYSTLEGWSIYSLDTGRSTAATARSTAASTYERALSTQEQARNYTYSTLSSLSNKADSYRSLAFSYGGAAKDRSVSTINSLLKRGSTTVSE